MEANESTSDWQKTIERLENLVIGVIAGWISYILITLGFPIVAFIGLINGIPPVWGYSLLSLIWVVSFMSLFIRVRMQRKQRIKRWKDVGEMLFLADYRIRSFHLEHLAMITNQHRTQYNDDIRSDIRNVLHSLLDLIAINLPSQDKAASFLIELPSTQTNDGRYQVVEHANHERILRQRNQKLPFGRVGSFAGQAMQQNTCLILRDHRRKNNTICWSEQPSSTYYGHAAVPVEIEQVHGDRRMVGVICMDFKQPYALTKEESLIFTMCADKIGTLWSKYQGDQAYHISHT